ncbi:hypothetical protein DSL72_007664 [Monilinia vaccinii-corymbosi]|uniref:Uncharacterized protein n=1 Tax=Monilinia vaccinii-corymbosi TaxID=61207 RepID=A0A8A3PIM9_9HELO|nr:hypothetical protein DSL72_007664 [Monilinia vaccinii-corymbosi]
MSEKAHMTADDLLLGGDTAAVSGDLGRRRTKMGREEVVSYGSGPVSVIGEEVEPDEKLEKLHGMSSYNGERRKSSKRGNQVYGEGFPLPVRSRTRISVDPRDSELERDMRDMRGEQLDRSQVGLGSRIRIVSDDEKERGRRDIEKDRARGGSSIPRVEIQQPEQDEIVVFEEDDDEERSHRRSRVGRRVRERSTARTIDTWERSEVGQSTIVTPTPRNESRGRSGVGESERNLKIPGLVGGRGRDLSIPRSVDSWERSDVGESTILSQRTKSRTPKPRSRVSARDKRERSSTRTVDTWERSEVGESTVLSGPGSRSRTSRSGLGGRDRERELSRVAKERERERERERDSGYEGGEVERSYGGRGYDGEGERWHGRGYEYKERDRGHSPVPSRLGESRRDRKMWGERGSGVSDTRRG